MLISDSLPIGSRVALGQLDWIPLQVNVGNLLVPRDSLNCWSSNLQASLFVSVVANCDDREKLSAGLNDSFIA